MEHNFMQTEKGIENFKLQVQQIVGSIQATNDLDVHMALINAPSYAKQVQDQYYMENTVNQNMRQYLDVFGFVQKNMNAIDILIEDTKALMNSWGSDEPDFMLCSGKLCFQLTMTQERTSYIAKGEAGEDLLKEGPILNRYRGLNVVKSRAFSMEEGSAPRDVMRRRVRTSEFYHGSTVFEGKTLNSVQLYDESTDNFCPLSVTSITDSFKDVPFKYLTTEAVPLAEGVDAEGNAGGQPVDANPNYKGYLLIRPNIEHWMLGMIIGKGGLDYLGATLW